LAARGILVRYYNKPDMSDFVRISAGTPQQTDALLAALHKIGASDGQ
jgi:histidinol-phosphate aminotransferase